MQQIVVEQDPDGTGPLERGQRGLDRAAQRVVEREQPWGFPGAQDEVGQAFSSIGEGANHQRLG